MTLIILQNIMSTIYSARRSLLFTPANRPTLFVKALGSGADMVCVDLEDAVAPDQKEAARAEAFAFLQQADNSTPERIVRINSLQSEAGQKDLLALLDARLPQGTLLVPKTDDAVHLQQLASRLQQAGSRLKLAALIESTIGVENAYAIVQAMPDLDFVMFGGADLAAELGTRVAPEPLAYARSRLVYAARSAQIDILDMPCLHFRNLDLVRQEAEHARLLGFTGKAVIHPANVELINHAFTPTREQLEEAQRYIETYNRSTTGVAVIDGKIVEKPVVIAMQKILARALAAGLKP